jgi:ribosomal protein S18 acetylase RimI-like enzyme
MDTHQIFDHLMDTFQHVGRLSKANITSGTDTSVITGYPSALFNLVRFDTKNHDRIHKLKSVNTPFICLPSKRLEAEFEAFAKEQDLVKADAVSASIFSNLEAFQYKPIANFKIQSVTNTDDLLAVDQISSVVFNHPPYLAFDFIKPALGNPAIQLFLAYTNDQPVGCGMLSFVNHQAGLYWLGVHPDFRNQGIATALVEYRMNIAKELGYTSIIAQNMTPSLGLYKRLGFKQQGELPLYMWNTAHYTQDVNVRSCLVL